MKHMRGISAAPASAVSDLYARLARLWSDFWYYLKWNIPPTGEDQ